MSLNVKFSWKYFKKDVRNLNFIKAMEMYWLNKKQPK